MKDKKYYVTMTDKFMSGWGYANGKINKLVIECDSYDEALIVSANAKDRNEMKYVNIVNEKPYYNKNRYFTNYHKKPEYKNWFRTDRPFKRERLEAI